MGRAEEIQELINTNLCLLKAGGHRIDFKQNLFKEHNIVGFEAVGYALLKIIDPTECINTIPWPLVNDKAQSREFRTNFVKFIKMINTKYTDAKIPEINASSLQFPGGMRFLEFIYKLSTFAVEVEWKKMLSPEDQEDLLPKLIPCTMSSQKVQLAMVRGALCREVETLQRLADYQAEGPSVLKVMNDCLNNTKTSCESVSEKLKEEVSSLDLDDETKASLLNIDDSTAITDYNERTENKYEEIEKNCRKLSHLHNLAAQCCQREKLSMETKCLDGHKLGLNRFSNKLVGGPMVNLKGDVKLLEVMRTAQTTINRLTSSSDSDSSSLLPPAQDLLVRCNSTVSRASKLEAALNRLLLENKQAVTTLRPRVYSTFDSNKIPEIFKHLQDRQPLNFLSPLSDIKEDKMVKRGSKRKSIGTIIQRKKVGVISYKTRREPRKHVSSTPFFKTPASRNSQNNSLSQKSQSSSTSRKSLNNTMLQFGLMHKEKDRLTPLRLTPKKKPVPNITEEKCDTDFYKCDEGNRHLEVTPDNVTVSSSAASSHGESVVSEPSPIPPLPPLPSVRRGRKSIDDIILRYRRLKQSQSSSYTSKNESDTCNESES